MKIIDMENNTETEVSVEEFKKAIQPHIDEYKNFHKRLLERNLEDENWYKFIEVLKSGEGAQKLAQEFNYENDVADNYVKTTFKMTFVTFVEELGEEE